MRLQPLGHLSRDGAAAASELWEAIAGLSSIDHGKPARSIPLRFYGPWRKSRNLAAELVRS